MKKILNIVLVLILCMSFLCIAASATGAEASFDGPKTVRAGDTITLTFNLNGTGLLGMQGVISYDESQVSLTKTTQKIGGSWLVEFNGNNVVAYDNSQENPISKKTGLFTATFKVKDLAVGTNVTISVTGVKASAAPGTPVEQLGTVSYTATIAAPKSTVNTLDSLSVGNATMTPAFSKDTTLYSVEVPFSVSKLELSYTKTDSKATVKVDNPTLIAGGTTKITVTVTSESGSMKVYTISAKRGSDPNYTPSSNNNLSGIRVGGFLLSPEFSADRTQYIIWLPYETESVTVTGLTADSKASARTEGGENLVAGADNEIKVICTAENGDEKVYTVIAKRAAAHDAQPTDPTQPSTQPTQPTQPSTQPTVPNDHVCPTGNNIPLVMVIVPWILAFATLAALVIVLAKSKKK